MIRGVPITANRKPTLAFQREWAKAMQALKALTPTLQTYPLPSIEVVDERGFPQPRFMQLTRLFSPAPPRAALVDRMGKPTDDMLSWWSQIV